MLSLNNLALRRGTELLLKDVTLTIHRGTRVGLVGANGTGKTSLFKLILAELDADDGDIELPRETRIAHMAQEIPALAQPAIDYVLAGDSAYAEVIRSLAQAEQDQQFERVASLHEQLDALDGYSARARGEQLMLGLGFNMTDLEQPVAYFSGGWRIRLSLARTLMQPADLLLLDEPSNHLDLDAIIWLAEWIRQFQGTLMLITHDREFLDECVDHIASIHHQTIELFRGNYSAFEKIKAARLAEQQSGYEKQQREIHHIQTFIRRFRVKASKARQAQSRLKSLERMTLIAPAHIDSPFNFSIVCAKKLSTPLIVLQDATLGYDEPVLRDIHLSFQPGDRFGLLGVNGAGKSTLIQTLTGALPLLNGSRIEGVNLKVGYFSQHQVDDLRLESSAFEHLADSIRNEESGNPDDKVSEQKIRGFLGGFNFHNDKIFEPVRLFSGGEKARLALALITWARPNLLLMDEPTNHLDIEMRQALTLALQSYAGALLLVSHDRHLMANTVDHFLLIENGTMHPFYGDLTDYRARTLPTQRKQIVQQPVKTNPGKALRQAKTRMNGLEKRIERLERKLAEIEHHLASPALYQQHQQQVDPELQSHLRDQLELKSQLAALEDEWLELSTSPTNPAEKTTGTGNKTT